MWIFRSLSSNTFLFQNCLSFNPISPLPLSLNPLCSFFFSLNLLSVCISLFLFFLYLSISLYFSLSLYKSKPFSLPLSVYTFFSVSLNLLFVFAYFPIYFHLCSYRFASMDSVLYLLFCLHIGTFLFLFSFFLLLACLSITWWFFGTNSVRRWPHAGLLFEVIFLLFAQMRIKINISVRSELVLTYSNVCLR